MQISLVITNEGRRKAQKINDTSAQFVLNRVFFKAHQKTSLTLQHLLSR